MFVECQQYLIGKLKENGISRNPITSIKRLEVYQGNRVGAVLFDTETLTRNGMKVFYTGADGLRHKRVKHFDRIVSFVVVIGDPKPEELEELFLRFILALDRGLVIDGNHTGIEIEDVEWSEEADSTLKAKVQRLVKVTFEGGLYEDITLTPRTGRIGVRIEKVKTTGKERGYDG